MTTDVLLTIDTELMWRSGVTRSSLDALFAASWDPAGAGVPYQLALLERHRLSACFFVDPMPACVYGIDPIRRMVEPILAAGQEVQLHLHPQWASLVDGVPTRSFELTGYDEAEQRALLEKGIALLMEAGAPRPIAFRAGSYAANDATLRAAAALGLRFESSHNGAYHPDTSAIDVPAERIAPLFHQGVWEVPVTVIRTAGGLRTLQICAVSRGELEAALRHAMDGGHRTVTLVSHSFELAARNGRRRNRVHAARFAGLCAFLDCNRTRLPTRRFDALRLEGDYPDVQPLPASRPRTLRRHLSQLWSNLVEERG